MNEPSTPVPPVKLPDGTYSFCSTFTETGWCNAREHGQHVWQEFLGSDVWMYRQEPGVPIVWGAPLSDARFRAVLRRVVADAVEETAEARNGECYLEREPKEEWLDGIVEQILRDPVNPLRAMLGGRERLRQNLFLIMDIDMEKIRAGLDDSDKADKIDALLDFVAEVRAIAKEI